MSYRRRRHRWSLLGMALTGGVLFQITGCNTIVAGISAGLLSSVSSTIIRNLVNEALNLGGRSQFF